MQVGDVVRTINDGWMTLNIKAQSIEGNFGKQLYPKLNTLVAIKQRNVSPHSFCLRACDIESLPIRNAQYCDWNNSLNGDKHRKKFDAVPNAIGLPSMLHTFSFM